MPIWDGQKIPSTRIRLDEWFIRIACGDSSSVGAHEDWENEKQFPRRGERGERREMCDARAP